MDSSPGSREPRLPQLAGVKRPAPGSLLPAFEFSSSPAPGRPAKRVASEDVQHRQNQQAKYPTPLPTSSTGIISSSPPRVAPAPAGLQRTQSTLSERVPLSDVPSVTLSEDGQPLLMGRSSNSSHYQLSSNRFISRVHIKAAYIHATKPFSPNRIELVCMGWNGIKVHCQGRASELAKGDTFTSVAENVDIMVDAQDARVLIAWPTKSIDSSRKGSLAPSETAWDEESSPGRIAGSGRPVFEELSPVRRNQRLQSPISPSPAIQDSANLPSGKGEPVVVYEDDPSADEKSEAVNEGQTQSFATAQILNESMLSHATQDQSEAEEFSDQDEENDPIITSFGPAGDNLLPRMASVRAGDSPLPPPLKEKTEDLSPRRSSSSASEDERTSPVANHVINQLAYSRLSSTPVSSILQNLPNELRRDPIRSNENKLLSIPDLQAILEATRCIGKVHREGKDAAGKALESEYYYLPDKDDDETRRATVVDGLRKPGLRNCRKQHKQYFWRRPKTP